jgi:DNA-binding MurR/RpiR family transcriptional regulator
MTLQLVDVNENDVLFAVSFLHYSQQTTRVMKHFHERGARVIFLTDSEMALPVRWSHLQLLAPTQWETVLISRCACIMVIEGLLSAMFRMADDQVQKRVDEIWRLSNAFNVLFPMEKDGQPAGQDPRPGDSGRESSDGGKTGRKA